MGSIIGQATAGNTNCLDKVQRRAARFVESDILPCLAAVPVDTFRRPTRTSGYSNGDTFTTLSSHIDSYK